MGLLIEKNKYGNVIHSSILTPDDFPKFTRWIDYKLCEEDYMLIEEVFRPAIKRCAKNAEACINSGYNSGSSQQKAEEWQKKGWRMQELLNRIAIEMT